MKRLANIIEVLFFPLLLTNCNSQALVEKTTPTDDSTNLQNDAATSLLNPNQKAIDSLENLLTGYNYTYDVLGLNDLKINGHAAEITLDELLKIEKIDSSIGYDFRCPSPFSWTDSTKGESWMVTY